MSHSINIFFVQILPSKYFISTLFQCKWDANIQLYLKFWRLVGNCCHKRDSKKFYIFYDIYQHAKGHSIPERFTPCYHNFKTITIIAHFHCRFKNIFHEDFWITLVWEIHKILGTLRPGHPKIADHWKNRVTEF